MTDGDEPIDMAERLLDSGMTLEEAERVAAIWTEARARDGPDGSGGAVVGRPSDDEPNAPPRFTDAELAWAASHDWYLGIDRTGRMRVRVTRRGADGPDGTARATTAHLSTTDAVLRHVDDAADPPPARGRDSPDG